MASRNLKYSTLVDTNSPSELQLTSPTLESLISIEIIPHGLLDRAFNLIGALIILALISPILISISLIILIKSGRPLFYRQKRIGQGGNAFEMIKFRTMVKDAHGMKNQLKHLNVMSGPFFKIKDDPRVTRVGKFLRRWSLDELPQIFNVLKGEMSLVGPRPMLPEEIEQLNCRDILRIKPGMTGLWQISGRNQIVDFRRKLALDRLYVQKKSLFLDFLILLMTAQAVVKGRGAY